MTSMFRPNGKRRLELGSLIMKVKILSKLSEDREFVKEIDDYLTLIKYDEGENTIQKVLGNKAIDISKISAEK